MDEEIVSGCGAVLIVADDDEIREDLRAALVEDGHRVHCAGDREEALCALTDEPVPCLILADLLNPRATSRELLDMLRPLDVLVTLPVILASSTVFPCEHAGRHRHAEVHRVKRVVDMDAICELVEEHCRP